MKPLAIEESLCVIKEYKLFFSFFQKNLPPFSKEKNFKQMETADWKWKQLTGTVTNSQTAQCAACSKVKNIRCGQLFKIF